jgi:catalase
LLAAAGVPAPESRDPGLLLVDDDGLAGAADAFIEAIAMHRAWERQTDPPRV